MKTRLFEAFAVAIIVIAAGASIALPGTGGDLIQQPARFATAR